jgi:CRISPR-associated protein Cmr5
MQTRDQKYATIAYERVTRVYKDEDKIQHQSYGSMAHKLPILIRSSGLAQALAFVAARGSDIQLRLLDDLAQTIDLPDSKQLLVKVYEADLSEYMHLTQQLMDALLWYKRFAQSILDIDASQAAQEDSSDRT